MSLACILKSHTLVFTYSLCPFIFVEWVFWRAEKLASDALLRKGQG